MELAENYLKEVRIGYKEKKKDFELNKVYQKYNSEAMDFNRINPFYFSKLYKKELLKY